MKRPQKGPWAEASVKNAGYLAVNDAYIGLIVDVWCCIIFNWKYMEIGLKLFLTKTVIFLH